MSKELNKDEFVGDDDYKLAHDILDDEREREDKVTSLIALNKMEEKMDVRVSMTLWDVASFDISSGTAQVTMDLHFVYDNRLWDHYFKGVGGTSNGVLPWMLANGLELNVANSCTWYTYGKTLSGVNIFDKKHSVMMHNESMTQKNNELIKFRCELYSLRGTIKILSFPKQDPFQNVYLIFKLCMDGTPGCEYVRFVFDKYNSSFSGAKESNGDFTKGKQIERNFEIDVNYGVYSRLYILIQYHKWPVQDLFKYYLLPFVICFITLLSANDTDVNIIETTGTYFLAVVALIFTLPGIGVVTRNEKSVVGHSLVLLAILGSLGFYNTAIVRIILWVVLLMFTFVNTAIDIWETRQFKEKNDKIIFESTGDDEKDLKLFETL